MMASLGYFVSGASSAAAGEVAGFIDVAEDAPPAASSVVAPNAAAEAPPILRKSRRSIAAFPPNSAIFSPRGDSRGILAPAALGASLRIELKAGIVYD